MMSIVTRDIVDVSENMSSVIYVKDASRYSFDEAVKNWASF